MDVKGIIFKIYLKLFILYGVALCAFGASSWFLVQEVISYRDARSFEQFIQKEEMKLRNLESFVQNLSRYEIPLARLTSAREAIIDEQILLEPFDNFLKKISSLYNEQGFFFMDSFTAITCIEIKDMKLTVKDKCVPIATIKGRMVYITHETP